MEHRSSYFVVGLFVIILMAALLAIAIWLTRISMGKPTNVYLTYLTDDVSGLAKQSPVRFNGVQVGYVDSITLDNKDQQKVRVQMQINKKINITVATIAVLTPEGIAGNEYVGLHAMQPNAPKLVAKPGDIYPVIPAGPSVFAKLSTAVQDAANSIITLAKDAQLIVDEKNRTSLHNILHNIDNLSSKLAGDYNLIHETLASANALFKSGTGVFNNLPKTVVSLDQALTKITQTMGQINKTVQNASDQLVPPLGQFLLNMTNLMGTLDEISKEVKLNPGILVRGKKPGVAGPGEKS